MNEISLKSFLKETVGQRCERVRKKERDEIWKNSEPIVLLTPVVLGESVS